MAIGINELSRFTQVEVDSLVAQIERPAPFLLGKFFPTKKLFNTKQIEFDFVDRDYRRLAPFVAPTVAGKPMIRDGYVTKSLSPASIKMVDQIIPQDGFVRRPGENYLTGAMSPQQRADDILAEQVAKQKDMILTRMEWMAAKALVDGAITISGEAYPTTVVNFQRSASLRATLTLGARWSQTTATPLDDLETFSLRVRERSKGAVVTDIIMDGRTWNLLRYNSTIMSLINTQLNNGNSSVRQTPRTDMNAAVYVGRLDPGLDLWVYDNYFVDDSGTVQPFLPPFTVIGASSGGIDGYQYYGAILDFEANMEAREEFTKVITQREPSAVQVITTTRPLVAPRRPDAMFVLTVN